MERQGGNYSGNPKYTKRQLNSNEEVALYFILRIFPDIVEGFSSSSA